MRGVEYHTHSDPAETGRSCDSTTRTCPWGWFANSCQSDVTVLANEDVSLTTVAEIRLAGYPCGMGAGIPR